MAFDDPQDPQQGPDDPYSPILKAIAAKVSQVPSQQAVLHRQIGGPTRLSPGISAFAPFFAELFGLGQGAATEETTQGVVPPGGTALDLTDPKNNPGDAKLLPSEQFVRMSRMLAGGIRNAVTGGLTGVGVERAVEAGELNPANDREKLVLQIAPMLAQLGVLVPLGMMGGAGAGIGPEPLIGSMAKGLGLGAQFGGVSSALEEAERPLLPGQPGTSATQIGQAGLKGMVDPTNLAFGAGFGSFNWAAGKLTAWLLPKLFNGGQPMAPRAAGPAVTMLESATEGQLSSIVPGPGMVIDGKQAVQTKTGQIKWRTKDPNTGQWRWAKTPDEVAMRNYGKDLLARTQAQANASPEGQAQAAATQAATPADPQTLPKELQDQAQQMQAVGAMYYNTQAGRLLNKIRGTPYGEESLKRELLTVKRIMVDPTLTQEERVTAGGRVAALEQVLKLDQSILAKYPFETEAAAIEAVRSIKPTFGRDGVLREAAQLAMEGNRPMAERMRFYADNDFPETVNAKITGRIRQANLANYKGIRRNSQVMYNGKLVKVVDRAGFGMTMIRDLTTPDAQPQYVDAAELTPVPKAGKTVRMKDGTVGNVEQVDLINGKAGVRQRGGALTSEDIASFLEVGDDETAAMTHQFEQKLADKPNAAAIVPVPPAKAVTTTGEAVSVEGTSKDAVKVRTRTGKTKILPREAVTRSTSDRPMSNVEGELAAIKRLREQYPSQFSDEDVKVAQRRFEQRAREEGWPTGQAPAPASGRPIVDFKPGDLPERGHKILFFRVQSANQQAFENAYEAGQLNPATLKSLVADRSTPKGQLTMDPHVLPPEIQEGVTKMYALELPANALPTSRYTALGKGALRALGGQGVVDHYMSPVGIDPQTFAAGRVYRVADELLKQAQLPHEALGFMSQEEQTSYLKNLINLNAHVEHETVQAASEARTAHVAGAKAIEEHDGGKFFDADQLRASKMAEIANAEVKSYFDNPEIDGALDETMAAAAELDADMQARHAEFEAEGLKETTKNFYYAMLHDLPAAPERGLEDKVMVSRSKNVPGQRLFVAKRIRPAVEGRYGAGSIQPGAETYYEMIPYDAQGRPLRDAITQARTEEEVEAYHTQHGYIPANTYLESSDYVHEKNPNLHISVRPTVSGQLEANVEQRAEFPQPQAFNPDYPNRNLYTPEQNKIIASILEQHQDAEAGGVYFNQKDRQLFDTQAQVDTWAKGLGYRATEGGEGDLSLAKRFADLPATNKLRKQAGATVEIPPRKEYTGKVVNVRNPATGELEARKVFRTVTKMKALKLVESNLKDIIKDAVNLQRRVPDPIVEYIHDFADIYSEHMGQPPFSKSWRSALGIPDVGDLMPNPNPQSIDPASVDLPNIPYTKGMNAPTPKTDQFITHVSLGELFTEDEFGSLELGPDMHTSGAVQHVPDDQTFLYTHILGVKGEGKFGEFDAAAKAAAQQAAWTKWNEAWQKAQNTSESGPAQFAPAQMSLGTYSPTGQVVQILPFDLTSGERPIKFPDGAELSVSKDLVEPSKFRTRDEHDYAIAGLVREGRYGEFFKREPDIGFGKVEQDLGLLGTRDREVLNQAIGTRARELAEQLSPLEGDNFVGPQEATDGLLDLYNRALWIRQETPEPLFPAGKVAGPARAITPLETEEHVLSAIRSVNPKLEKPFRMAAYNRYRAQAGDTPFGDLRAKAHAGLMRYDSEALDDLRKALGISKNVPNARVIEEAINRRMFDPTVARAAQVFNSELGFFGWLDKAEMPAEVHISRPYAKDIGLLTEYGVTPFKKMQRHPQTRMIMNLIDMASAEEHRYNRRGPDLVNDLVQNGGYKLAEGSEHALELDRIRTTYDTWPEALAAGVDPRYQFGFNRLKKFYDEGFEDHIRDAMQKGIQPVYINMDQIQAEREKGSAKIGELESWLHLHGIDPNKMMPGFAVLTRERVPEIGFHGEVEQGRFTHDDIESFLQLRRQYDSAAELPEGTDPRFVRDFDFWKRYGRKRYVSHVQNGNIAITINRGGQDLLAGWAQSFHEAAFTFRDLVERGAISDAEARAAKFVPHGEVTDDIDTRLLRASRSEWNRAMKAFAEHIGADGEDVKGLFLSQRLGPTEPAPGLGTLQSAKPRVANLPRPHPDIITDALAYNARIARAQYRFKVAKAWQVLENQQLDRSLSAEAGVPELSSMPRLKQDTRDFIKTALGEYTDADLIADKTAKWAMMSWAVPQEAGRKVLGALRLTDGSPLSWGDILNSETYFRKYGGRSRASSTVAFQALRKLIINPASAFYNAAQFHVNAYPFARGANEAERFLNANKAWVDGVRLWHANTFGGGPPKHLEALWPLIREIGPDLMPSKQLAGGGGSSWGDVAGTFPRLAGKSMWNYSTDVGKWMGMLAFNGGEQSGRFAAVVMELQGYLKEHGVDWTSAADLAKHPDIASEAMFSAKRLMEKTFFKYDALGMPKFFSKLGPAGRLLFQFKPYIVQQTGLEYDMLRDALHGKPGAWGQLGRHAGAVAVLGGATGLMAHPILTYTGGLIRMLLPGHPEVVHVLGHSIPLSAAGLEAIAEDRRTKSSTPDERMDNTMHYRWDDVLYYGLPGLLHVAAGNRLSVSGQDITPDFSNIPNWLMSEMGPTYGLYPQLAQAWGKYLSTGQGTGKAVLGGVAGAVLSQAISSKLTGGAPLQLTGLAGGLVGAWLASRHANNPFGDFLARSKEGKTLMLSLIPSEMRNSTRTWEMYKTGNLTNLDGEPTHVPYANRTEEMLAMLAGVTSIRREEAQAVNSFENSLSARYNTTREILVNEMAYALKEGNTEEVWKTAMRAQNMGIDVPESAIQNRLQDLVQESMTTIQQHQNMVTRYTSP